MNQGNCFFCDNPIRGYFGHDWFNYNAVPRPQIFQEIPTGDDAVMIKTRMVRICKLCQYDLLMDANNNKTIVTQD